MNWFRDMLNTVSPVADDERELGQTEASWADFVHAARTGNRFRRGAMPKLLMRSLDEVHRELDQRRGEFEAGNRYALFLALCVCAEEGVPMPYWLADALLQVKSKINKQPASLHDLFGANEVLPAAGKLAINKRRNVRLQARLYFEASRLIAAGMSKDAALKSALGLPGLKNTMSARKARQLFDAQDKIQQHALALRAAKPPA